MVFTEKPKISVEDYLQSELLSDVKHEYVGGEVYAMVGVKDFVIDNVLELCALLRVR
ncbi:Uma2 family endonuclease [Methylotuvimicrobium alcaliphilum]|nr:Uma2 family endonuclease [Methylotuvimicrobium alcaliphilum]